jgi:hypothetical protein
VQKKQVGDDKTFLLPIIYNEQCVVDKKFKWFGKYIVDVDKKIKLTIIHEKKVFVVQYFTFLRHNCW